MLNEMMMSNKQGEMMMDDTVLAQLDMADVTTTTTTTTTMTTTTTTTFVWDKVMADNLLDEAMMDIMLDEVTTGDVEPGRLDTLAATTTTTTTTTTSTTTITTTITIQNRSEECAAASYALTLKPPKVPARPAFRVGKDGTVPF